MKLSKHFTLEELLITKHKDLKALQETEVKPFLNNLYIVCNYILEPIRNYYKVPVTVTSGFRGKALNERVGGNINSDHCKGLAADFIVKDKKVDDIFNDIKDGKIDICYRQLIKEIIDGKEWIHIAGLRLPYDEKDKYMQKLTTKDGKNFVEVK
jgi:hypothetical protein